MKEYIKLNTQIRGKSKNDFEKDFYKLVIIIWKFSGECQKHSRNKIRTQNQEIKLLMS